MKQAVLRISVARTLVFMLMAFASQLNAQGSASRAQKSNAMPTIFDVWVKTTVPGGTVSAAYMHIKSAVPVKLVKAESPIAAIVEIHEMKMNDGVMEMKGLDAVEIPANKLIDLKPGGLHIMLMKLKKSINPGDKVPLTLTFEGADKKPFVVKLDAVAKEKHSSGHKH